MLDKKTQTVEGQKNIVAGRDLYINIPTIHAHQLQEEAEIQKNYRKDQLQLSKSNPELAIGEFLSAGELTQYKISGESDFLKLLSKYSLSLPNNLREEILRTIISSAWHTIVFQPFFSVKLIKMSQVNGNEIMRFLQILCEISLKKPINPCNLKEFILLLTNDEYTFENVPLREHKALVAQVIMHCFYHQDELLKSSIVIKELTNLAYVSDRFWDEFFVDLYFRYICGHIHICQHLLLPVKSAFERYKLTYSNKPLSRLAPIMISPYEFFKKHNRDDFVNNITDIAIDCRNHYECKWTISAFMRVIQLYKSSDEEDVYTDLVISIIDSFHIPLKFNSHAIIFKYLHSLLIAFMFTKDINYLKKYEKQFMTLHHNLVSPEIIHLQLEYASSLLQSCHLLDMENIEELAFGDLVSTDSDLLDTTLFSNHLIIGKPRNRPRTSLQSKAARVKWLKEYISQLYRMHAKPMIKENHLNVLNLKISKSVYHIRKGICVLVAESLPQFVDKTHDYPASFYCKSIRLFPFIPNYEHYGLMEAYIENAMRADNYEIIINANDILKSLSTCYHYGKEIAKKRVEKIAENVANISGIGKSEPRLYWAHYASIIYADSIVEKQFIAELWKVLKHITRKITQLSLRRDEVVQVSFSTEVIETIRNQQQIGSIFAAAASNELNNPELWNTIATTSFNYTERDDVDRLNMCAYFYSLAKCFARSQKDFDQKYCYNYIRCKALRYIATGIKPEDFYIRDTASYLSKSTSNFFAFKEECTDNYFDLLSKYWNEISLEHRQFIMGVLFKNVLWVRTQLHSRNISKI